jgi:hypothetical protein
LTWWIEVEFRTGSGHCLPFEPVTATLRVPGLVGLLFLLMRFNFGIAAYCDCSTKEIGPTELASVVIRLLHYADFQSENA